MRLDLERDVGNVTPWRLLVPSGTLILIDPHSQADQGAAAISSKFNTIRDIPSASSFTFSLRQDPRTLSFATTFDVVTTSSSRRPGYLAEHQAR
jgi:hypothetical protein